MNNAKLIALLTVLCVAACNHDVSQPLPKTAPSQTIQLDPVVSKPEKPTRTQLLAPMFEQIKQEETEMLPFDEPRHEFGEQLDGKLREQWMDAYYHHHPTYEFNGDKYYTMFKGKPYVPQVCVDFIIDTLDRTAGTWYAASLKYPHRTKGRFDFRNFIIKAGLNVRSAPDVLAFFKSYPNSFQFIFDGESPMTTAKTAEMQAWMKQFDVQLGDLIIIKGRAPWDHGKEIHWHSMFVTGFNESGEVALVTGNPIYPVERTLKTEGNRAPKRRIVAIIRFSDGFLGEITGLMPGAPM